MPRYQDGKINTKELFNIITNRNQDFISQLDAEIERIRRLIEEKTVFLKYEANEEFVSDTRDLVKKTNYRMNGADAKHILIAHSYGINCFATKDGDFWLLDNANVYVLPVPHYKTDILGRRNVFIPYNENII